MLDWQYAQKHAHEELARITHFSIKKREGDRDIEFRITVREYVERPAGQHCKYFAQADKHVNQKTAAVLPCGWGKSEMEALADCAEMIRQFPYEE